MQHGLSRGRHHQHSCQRRPGAGRPAKGESQPEQEGTELALAYFALKSDVSMQKRNRKPSSSQQIRAPVAARRGTKKKSSRPEMQLYRLVPQVSPWIQRLVALLPAVARSFWICSANLWPSRRCARSNPSPWNIHSVGVGARSSQRTSGPKAKYTSQAGAW